MEVGARACVNVEKFRRQVENELEELQEQIGIHIHVSPPLVSLTLVSILISHPIADAFEESSQDLESAKSRLEVEVAESRITNDCENEAREAAETARVRIHCGLAKLCEKYDGEVIICTNLERYATSPCSYHQHTLSSSL